MPKANIGSYVYDEQYLIEQDTLLFGPFESKSDAAEFAMKRLDEPWTLHTLNTPCAP